MVTPGHGWLSRAAWLLFALAVVLMLLLLFRSCKAEGLFSPSAIDALLPPENAVTLLPDTQAVASLPATHAQGQRVVPVRITVAKLPDTLARQRAERRAISISVRYVPPKRRFLRKPSPDSLVVETLLPTGIRVRTSYPGSLVLSGVNWGIDSVGNVVMDADALRRTQRSQKRARSWRRVGRIAAGAGAIVGTLFILN